MKRKWFGTDGVRGVFGAEPMTTAFAERCGFAAGKFFKPMEDGKVRLVIGRDTRASGQVLQKALTFGVEAAGGEVVSVGVLPTAAISWFTAGKGCSGGIVVSASHNPAAENGIKFFGPDGKKLTDEEEQFFETLLEETGGHGGNPIADSNDFQPSEEGLQDYRMRLLGTLGSDFHLKGCRILVDAANGAAWFTTPDILERLGATVVRLHGEPDGANINADCGSTHPESALRAVREQKGSIGIIHDGDADRVYMIDEEGELLDGDDLMVILALDGLSRGTLKHQTLVATSMSNYGLEAALKEQGGRIVRTDVGDRYVMEAIRSGGYNLGGEQSGHIILPDLAPCGDGLLVALQVLAAAHRSGKRLSESRQVLKKYPQSLQSLRVKEKPPLETIPGLPEALRRAEESLAGQGRVVLRYSGTEKKIRLLVEAGSSEKIHEVNKKLIEALEPILDGSR